MIINRHISDHLKKLMTFFPVLSLTGPRQAGKTTLLKAMLPDFKYVSFENPDIRLAIQDDPRPFLKEYSDKVIFDEAQRYPDLFSYLQGMVDDDRRPGRFVLSGSQNFLLRKNITQSLAGRVGIAQLLPLDNAELKNADLLPQDYMSAMYNGSYPGLISNNFEPVHFYRSYLDSYVERDVAELISSRNLDIFRRFLRLCAANAGQNVNLSKLAVGSGVSVPTVQSWIGVLQQSYIIFKLPPFFRNFGKRLIKSPKLYFYDTGLLCHLLGMVHEDEINNSAHRGALFENFVIADAFKSLYHAGSRPDFYYYRDKAQREVDLIYERANSAELWEIKIADEAKSKHFKTLEEVAGLWDKPSNTNLIYTGYENNLINQTQKINWRNLDWKL